MPYCLDKVEIASPSSAFRDGHTWSYRKSDTTLERPEASVSERFNALRQELKELQAKTAQFESDEQDHQRVLASIAKLPEDRKCYRQVGEILVQMNLAQAKLALEQHQASLKDLITQFQAKTEAKQKELVDFQKANNIQIRSLRDLQGEAA
jgi:prefoldin subunit 2